jgi:hypothetical protein
VGGTRRVGKSARDYPDRPQTMDELFADESVAESGTHSILDMTRVLPEGEPPKYGWLAAAGTIKSPLELGRLFAEHGEPEYGTVAPVTAAEALERTGVDKLTETTWTGSMNSPHTAGSAAAPSCTTTTAPPPKSTSGAGRATNGRANPHIDLRRSGATQSYEDQ